MPVPPLFCTRCVPTQTTSLPANSEYNFPSMEDIKILSSAFHKGDLLFVAFPVMAHHAVRCRSEKRSVADFHLTHESNPRCLFFEKDSSGDFAFSGNEGTCQSPKNLCNKSNASNLRILSKRGFRRIWPNQKMIFHAAEGRPGS